MIVKGILFMLGLASTMGTTSNNLKDDECMNNRNDTICLDASCVYTAADVLKTIDPTVDPCDDFYEFACGNFLETTDIPDDEFLVAKGSTNFDLVNEQLKRLLQKKQRPDEPRHFVLAKKFYDVCMNTSGIETYGLTPAQEVLKSLGGWPVLEGKKWNATAFDWKTTIYNSRQAGLPLEALLKMEVKDDFLDKSQRILEIDEATLPFERKYFLEGIDSDIMKSYLKYLVDLAVSYGANRKNANMELKKSVKFQIDLAKITIPPEERSNITNLINRMTFSECQQRFPHFPCLEYINRTAATPGARFSSNYVVNVNVPNYLTQLEALLGQTPKRVLANYIFGEAVNKMAFWLTKEVYALKWDFDNLIYGSQAMHPRWKDCILMSIDKLNIATSAIYVRNHFDENTKMQAETLVQEVKDALVDLLGNEAWMDQNTKAKAIEKAKSMFAHVAYPQELLDDRLVENYYGGVDSSDVFLRHFLNLEKFAADVRFEKLWEPLNKTDWRDHVFATQVNAYHRIAENSIIIPAAILQGIFFDALRPKYMNFGSMGLVIGHEMTHGFDDRGRKVDKDGVVADWWSKDTVDVYLNKTRCFVEQYNNYSVPHLNLSINGLNTLEENIADAGGLKLAYLAYNAWVQRNHVEAQLPGLSFSSKQMFWISAANLWCAKESDAYATYLINAHTFPPASFRILGSFSNSAEFARDFNCRSGSKMNPAKKCSVW